jgi:hypothetical protein
MKEHAMTDETTTLPATAPAPAPAPLKRSHAWIWILGSVVLLLGVAVAVVLLFFRLPAYRMIAGDHKYTVAVEKENAKVALRTAGTSYAAAVMAARTTVSNGQDAAAPQPYRVRGSLAFGLDDGLLAGLGVVDGPDSATLAEAIRNLHLDFDSNASPEQGESRTDLTLGYGSSDLIQASLVALSDGRLMIDAPDLFSYLLVFSQADLSGASGTTPLPTGAITLPSSQLEAILGKLDVDGPALSKALAAYADLYAAALDQGFIAAGDATSVDVGDVTVPCTTMRIKLTGEQFASMMQAILAHASTDRVLYDETVGALHDAMQAVVDAAGTPDEVAALKEALDALPTFDAWTTALSDAAKNATVESLNVEIFTQWLSIASDGRVVSRTLSLIPATATVTGTQTLTFAQVPLKNGAVTHVAYTIEGAQVFDIVDRTTLGLENESTGKSIVNLDAVSYLAQTNLGQGTLTVDYDATAELATQKTDLELAFSLETDWLDPADTLTLTVHNEGVEVDGGTTTVVLEYDSSEGKASLDFTVNRLPAESFEVVRPTADNSIDLGNPSEEDSLALQMELQTNLPTVLERVQKAAPELYDWFLANFVAQ